MKKLGFVGSIDAMYSDSAIPITEIVLVELTDVDDMAYFAGTVGQKKEIRYYDIDYTLMYKDVFEYFQASPTEIKIIKRTKKNFYKGLYDASTNTEPTGGNEGDFYYIDTAGTINMFSLIKNDVLMKINAKWVKGKYAVADNKWVSA